MKTLLIALLTLLAASCSQESQVLSANGTDEEGRPIAADGGVLLATAKRPPFVAAEFYGFASGERLPDELFTDAAGANPRLHDVGINLTSRDGTLVFRDDDSGDSPAAPGPHLQIPPSRIVVVLNLGGRYWGLPLQSADTTEPYLLQSPLPDDLLAALQTEVSASAGERQAQRVALVDTQTWLFGTEWKRAFERTPPSGESQVLSADGADEEGRPIAAGRALFATVKRPPFVAADFYGFASGDRLPDELFTDAAGANPRLHDVGINLTSRDGTLVFRDDDSGDSPFAPGPHLQIPPSRLVVVLNLGGQYWGLPLELADTTEPYLLQSPLPNDLLAALQTEVSASAGERQAQRVALVDTQTWLFGTEWKRAFERIPPSGDAG